MLTPSPDLSASADHSPKTIFSFRSGLQILKSWNTHIAPASTSSLHRCAVSNKWKIKWRSQCDFTYPLFNDWLYSLLIFPSKRNSIWPESNSMDHKLVARMSYRTVTPTLLWYFSIMIYGPLSCWVHFFSSLCDHCGPGALASCVNCTLPGRTFGACSFTSFFVSCNRRFWYPYPSGFSSSCL